MKWNLFIYIHTYIPIYIYIYNKVIFQNKKLIPVRSKSTRDRVRHFQGGPGERPAELRRGWELPLCASVCACACLSVWGRDNVTLSQDGCHLAASPPCLEVGGMAEGRPPHSLPLRWPEGSASRGYCFCRSFLASSTPGSLVNVSNSRLTLISADSYQPHTESWKLA